MIVIAGTVPIKPDGREAAIAASTEMQRATREEPGCGAYQFSFAIDDEHLVCIYEEWADQAALDAHFATPHMATFRGQLASIVAGAGTFTKHEVSSTGPLFGDGNDDR